MRARKLSSPPVLSIVRSASQHLAPAALPAQSLSDDQQDCIDELRNLLKIAEGGGVSGMALVWTVPTGSYRTDIFGDLYDSHTFTIGALEVLKVRLLKKFLK